MKKNFFSSIIILLSCITISLFTGCSGKKEPETLADTYLTQEVKELYDAKALLDKANSLFDDKDYTGAIEEYKRFLELHPLHRAAPYAQFRIGLAYFNQIRTIDRDIEPVENAYSSFELLLRNYPGSKYEDEAREKIKICREKLAEREFYVGRFYLKIGKHPAAIERFSNILSKYNDTGVAQKTMYYLAVAYADSGNTDKAIATLKYFLERYPTKTKYKKAATNLLTELRQLD